MELNFFKVRDNIWKKVANNFPEPLNDLRVLSIFNYCKIKSILSLNKTCFDKITLRLLFLYYCLTLVGMGQHLIWKWEFYQTPN